MNKEIKAGISSVSRPSNKLSLTLLGVLVFSVRSPDCSLQAMQRPQTVVTVEAPSPVLVPL